MSVTFGEALQIVVSLTAIIAASWRLSDRLARLETKVEELWDRSRQRRSSD